MGDAGISDTFSANSACEVLCIGHAAWDIFLYIDEYPQENTKQLLSDSEESSGGPACNAAALLGRWGVHCSFAGLVGADPPGSLIRSALERDGIGVQALEIREGSRTALSIVMVNRQSGSRTILTRNRGEGRFLLSDDFLKKLQPRFILLDGHEPEASRQAMEACPEAVTVLDAGGYRAATVSLAGEVDYLIASERFAAGLCGVDKLEDEKKICEGLRALEKICTGHPAVTLGERGCAYVQEGEVRRIRGIPVKAVDTTAAGDIFHGAFVYALLMRRAFHDALVFANRTAALSVTMRGGRGAIPGLGQVEND